MYGSPVTANKKVNVVELMIKVSMRLKFGQNWNWFAHHSPFKRLILPICINYWLHFCAEMTGGMPPPAATTYGFSEFHSSCSAAAAVGKTWRKMQDHVLSIFSGCPAAWLLVQSSANQYFCDDILLQWAPCVSHIAVLWNLQYALLVNTVYFVLLLMRICTIRSVLGIVLNSIHT